MNKKELQSLANEMRSLMLKYSSKTPGFHIAPSLGLVEVSLALSEVFDLEKTTMIFDIGHQRYPFLMAKEYKKTRQLKIPEKENKYDFLWHPTFAGLSTATAAGLCISSSEKIITIIGDGSFTSGEVYEGLNLLEAQNSNMLLIYNQNDMSIRENVGRFKNRDNLKEYIQGFGFDYIGIVDGHNIDQLLKVFHEAKKVKKKLFIHIKTIKGRGYAPAEKDPLGFHQPFSIFNIENGEFFLPDDPIISNFFLYYKALQEVGLKYLKRDRNTYFVFPSTPPLQELLHHFPEQVFDTGIAEQACITFATALSLENKKVFVSMFSTFLSRCFSQVIDLCLSNSSVVIVMFFNGLTPFGMVQQSLHIFNILRSIPNCVILQPCNLQEFHKALEFSLTFKGPIFIQVPKEEFETNISFPNFNIGQGTLLTSGDKLTVLPIGSMFHHAQKIAIQFKGVEIINPRFLEPFDYDILTKSIEKTKKLLIIEDGYKKLGMGSEIINYVDKKTDAIKIKWIAAKNKFLEGQNYEEAQKFLGISKENIFDGVNAIYND